MKMHGDRWWMILCGASLLVGFLAGRLAWRWEAEDDIRCEARRQLLEFVQIADRMGIIDRGRLDELAGTARGERNSDGQRRSLIR